MYVHAKWWHVTGSKLLVFFLQMPWKRRKKQPDDTGTVCLFGKAFSSVSGAPEGYGDGGAPEGHSDGGSPEGHHDGGAPEGHGYGGAPEGKDEEWVSQSMQDDDEMVELYSTITSLADGIEEDHLGEEASEMMRHPMSKRCWALYNNHHNMLFLLYCVMHDQDSLMDDMVQDLDSVLLEFQITRIEAAIVTVKGSTLSNEVNCPVKLDWMMGQCFLWYLLSLRSSEGNRLLASVYCNKHAALHVPSVSVIWSDTVSGASESIENGNGRFEVVHCS